MDKMVHFYIMHNDVIYDEECTLKKATEIVHNYWFSLPINEKMSVNQAFYVYEEDGKKKSMEWGVERWKHALMAKAILEKHLGSSGKIDVVKQEPDTLRIECFVPLKRKGLGKAIMDCGFRVQIRPYPNRKELLYVRFD